MKAHYSAKSLWDQETSFDVEYFAAAIICQYRYYHAVSDGIGDQKVAVTFYRLFKHILMSKGRPCYIGVLLIMICTDTSL